MKQKAATNSSPVPWFVLGFFKLITPFIDQVTREKLKFNEDLRQHVPPAHLISAYGGDVEFVYDHQVYWPELMKLAAQRREEQRARWESSGKRVGESEVYLRGGPITVPDLLATSESFKQSNVEPVVKMEANVAMPDVSGIKAED